MKGPSFELHERSLTRDLGTQAGTKTLAEIFPTSIGQVDHLLRESPTRSFGSRALAFPTPARAILALCALRAQPSDKQPRGLDTQPPPKAKRGKESLNDTTADRDN